MTHYLIAVLLKGELAEYVMQLWQKIEAAFPGSTPKTCPPHITLKSPFTTDSLARIKQLLAEFTQRQAPAGISVVGIDHFHENVVFLDVIQSRRFKELYKSLRGLLLQNTDLVFGEYEQETIHAHITLCYAKPHFAEVIKLLEAEQPQFAVLADNITLLAKRDDRWEIEEEYLLTRSEKNL